MTTPHCRVGLLLVALSLPAIGGAQEQALAHELLAELVGENTAPSGGPDLRPTVDRLVERLGAEGFVDDDIDVVYSGETLPNLVFRVRAKRSLRRPIVMMAHLDVVEGLPEDWTVPPYELTESDGWYYGRGTTDNKAGAAILVATMIRLKREGYQPDRDLIVMLTADEESTGEGALALANEHRELIEAEYALNTDGGMVLERNGRAGAFIMQTSEKVYMTFRFEATDPGGHSSLPRADSAISRLARALVDLQAYRFPIELNETTRAFFTRWADLAPADEQGLIRDLLAGVPDAELSPALDRVPYYNSLARTTCVATMIDGGHALNALPQKATAAVNCRVLPQSGATQTRAMLESLAEPHGVTVTQIEPDRPSPPSPLNPDVVGPITDVAQEFWPGIVVIPEMSTGATDGLFLRNVGIPVYAISAIAEDPDDIRAHGQDERLSIEAFDDATEYWYRLVRRLSDPGRAGDD